MLNLYKNAQQYIFFTASENATIANPFFLFVFTHKITGEEVILMVTSDSNSKRYDSFDLDVSTELTFLNSTLGFWGYTIYQKETDTDFTKTGVILESGFMVLHPTSVTLPTEYTEQSNIFKIYNGE